MTSSRCRLRFVSQCCAFCSRRWKAGGNGQEGILVPFGVAEDGREDRDHLASFLAQRYWSGTGNEPLAFTGFVTGIQTCSVADFQCGTGSSEYLNLVPTQGLILRGDLGFISSETAGLPYAARSYWSCLSDNLVNSLPPEAQAYSDTRGELTFQQAAPLGLPPPVKRRCLSALPAPAGCPALRGSSGGSSSAC